MVQKIFRKVAQFRELQLTYATLSNSKNRLTQFTIKRDERGEGEKKQGKKIPQRHTKTLIITLLLSLERYRQDESNNIKKCHKQ
jgi:hypothetical protein